MDFSFSAPIRLRNNGVQPASWHFVTLPLEISKEIRTRAKTQPRKGRGCRVEVRVGFLTRETSIFYTKEQDRYMLPIKADVRKQLRVKAEDTIHINLQII